MASISRIRIACDSGTYDAPVNVLDGRKVTFWRGSDLQFELALFHHGVLESLDNLESITVAVKALAPHDTPPPASDGSLMEKELGSEFFQPAMAEDGWRDGSQQQILVPFSGDETAIPAGDAWLVIWAKTGAQPSQLITWTAGRISVLESAGGVVSGPPPPLPEPAADFYDKASCDAIFARRSANLGDLSQMASARENLGLGTAAQLGVKNEEDLQSDSADHLPTQHSVKTYVDTAALAGKNYADGVALAAKAYADGVGEDVRTYADGQIAALAPAAPTSATNYWPTDTLCYRSSYAKFSYMAGTAGVCGPDGWFIYQDSPNVTMNQRVYWRTYYDFDLLGEGEFQLLRQQGNTTTALCTVSRPFTIRETNPIRGQTVTLAFDYRFGTGFPRNQAGNGVQIDVFYAATTDPSINLTIGTDGTFTQYNALLVSFPEIVDGPIDGTRARYVQTFTVPTNALQICLRIRHLPPTGAPGVSGYSFFLRHPTLHLGSSDLGFPYPLRGEEDSRWNQRFQWVEAGFFGPVMAGQVIKQRCTFPNPIEFAPKCLRCEETYTTTAFPTGTYADVSEITTKGFTLTRTASADSDSGRFRGNYKFGCILFPFSDPIASY